MGNTKTKNGLVNISRKYLHPTFYLGMVNCGLYFNPFIQWLNLIMLFNWHDPMLHLYDMYTWSSSQQDLVRIRWEKGYMEQLERCLVLDTLPIVVFDSLYAPFLWSALWVKQLGSSKSIFFLLLASKFEVLWGKCDVMLAWAIIRWESFLLWLFCNWA